MPAISERFMVGKIHNHGPARCDKAMTCTDRRGLATLSPIQATSARCGSRWRAIRQNLFAQTSDPARVIREVMQGGEA